MRLSLVTPAYDEVGLIADTVRVLDAHLRQLGISYEIIVGDDGSSDGTAEAVRALALPNVSVVTRPHSGKGGILSACLAEAKGGRRLIDCDLEIDQLPRGPLDEFDGAATSRRVDRADVAAAVSALIRPLSPSPTTGSFLALRLADPGSSGGAQDLPRRPDPRHRAPGAEPRLALGHRGAAAPDRPRLYRPGDSGPGHQPADHEASPARHRARDGPGPASPA